MVSALPSLAFFALSKLVFTATKGTPAPQPAPATAPADTERLIAQLTARITELETRPTTNPVPALTPATSAPASSSDTAPAQVAPVADNHDHGHNQPQSRTARHSDPTPDAAVPAAVRHADSEIPSKPEPVAAQTPGSDLADLLPGARIIADAHQQAHGTPITHGQLAVRMGVNSSTARNILTALTKVGTPTTQPHNGTPIGVRA
jgi:hypothetical protein